MSRTEDILQSLTGNVNKKQQGEKPRICYIVCVYKSVVHTEWPDGML